jgi:hypothetical protein
MPAGRLFAGFMYMDRAFYEETKLSFGEPLIESDEFIFDFTDSYEKEMGKGLLKRFVIFKKTIERDELPSIKIRAREIEKRFSEGGKRRINIDPGYITPNNVIVASTKDHPHRIYLSSGIYGDIQLMFRKDSAVTLPNTYQDYNMHKELFHNARKA